MMSQSGIGPSDRGAIQRGADVEIERFEVRFEHSEIPIDNFCKAMAIYFLYILDV